jgi:endonuclease YncB( thermonuclease family)
MRFSRKKVSARTVIATEIYMIIRLALLLMLIVANHSFAEESLSVSDFQIKGIYATKPDDFSIYCLLGGGSCLLPRDRGTADAFIASWLSTHPNAIAIPISTESKILPLDMPSRREFYIWIEDGEDSLTLSLIREGFYSKQAMADMVEAERRLAELEDRALNNSHNEVMRERMEKRRSQVPLANRPQRLISDSDYAEKMNQASIAEQVAKQGKKGLWSDAAPPGASLPVAGQMSREPFSVQDLYVGGIYAHRLGGSDIYCLLGGNVCVSELPMPTSHQSEIALITTWLASHPHATAIPISAESKKIRMSLPPVHSTYIWIEDGEDSLNVELVRQGFYRASAMNDMVEADQQFMEMFKDPRLASGLVEIAKERAEEELPRRLILDSDYAKRMKRVAVAEHDAQRGKRGMWSDVEMKRWNPPSDAQMIKDYADHKSWFKDIATSTGEDPRLANVSRDPESWKRARGAGVPQERIDEYVKLLEKLGANETLSSVYGIGKVCLITADIVLGLFDNGIIKGYVFSPSDPHPLFKDLEHWPSDAADVTTAYRPVADDWYLFEVHH